MLPQSTFFHYGGDYAENWFQVINRLFSHLRIIFFRMAALQELSLTKTIEPKNKY